MIHKTGTNSALSRLLGTFNAGDTITATVWFYGTAQTAAQVFLGNVSTTPFTDPIQKQVSGTGAWQQVTLTKTVTVTGPFRFYLYGNTNGTTPDLTSTNYDDVLVTSVQRGTVLSEGFESGLALTTDLTSTTAWYRSGEPTDVDVAGQAGMAEWQKSMVYGFGQLLSEDHLIDGTLYVQSDQVGSPNLITDGTGHVLSQSKNLPYGERFGSVNLTTNPNIIKSIRRFTNHEDEPGSAIYMQARTYLPAYGKFAQVDPAYDQTKDDPESWNLYNYVTNNPVTHTDPDGRINTDEGMVAANIMWMHLTGSQWESDPGFGPGTPANFQLGPQVHVVTVNVTYVINTGQVLSITPVERQKPSASTAQTGFGGGSFFSMALGSALFGQVGQGKDSFPSNQAGDPSTASGQIMDFRGGAVINVQPFGSQGLMKEPVVTVGGTALTLATGAAVVESPAAASLLSRIGTGIASGFNKAKEFFQNLGSSGSSSSNLQVQFGANENQVFHTFRHTDALGLARADVMNAVQTHLSGVASQMTAGEPFRQVITVGGQRIQYTAFMLSNGTINIGRINEFP